MPDKLDPRTIYILKYLNKHPDITTDKMRKKFGNDIESLLDELFEEHYIRNRSCELKDWNNWFIDDKGINAIKANRFIFVLSLVDRIITSLISFAIGVAVGYAVFWITLNAQHDILLRL